MCETILARLGSSVGLAVARVRVRLAPVLDTVLSTPDGHGPRFVEQPRPVQISGVRVVEFGLDEHFVRIPNNTPLPAARSDAGRHRSQGLYK